MTSIKTILAAALALLLLASTPVFALTVSGTLGDDVQLDAGSAAVQVDASTSADASGNIPLVVTQASPMNALSTVVAPEEITTRIELSNFISSKLHGDAGLAGVDAASDHVAVTYREPGFFLGVIPVLVDTTAITDASGNVSLTHPWWGFLGAPIEADLVSRVQSGVDAVLGTNASDTAQLNVSQQAQLESAIEEALAAAAKAHASAAASGRASAQ